MKASPEKLRPASEEEYFTLSGWLEGISNAKKQFETGEIKGMIDLSTENDDLPAEIVEDYWRRDGDFWIRVHVKPRELLFHPDSEQLYPDLDIDRLKPWRKNVMRLQDGTTQTFEDDWNYPADRPVYRLLWTGETWFEQLAEDQNPPPKRGASMIEPTTRLTKKTRFELAPSSGVDGVEEDEPTPTPDGELPIQPPPGLAPIDRGDLPDRPAPDLEENSPMVDTPSTEEEDRKRDHEEVELGSDAGIEAPVSKRSRLELLEVYYNEVLQKFTPKQKKGKEATMKDFQGRDFERLQRAIHKEYNNNLATGAYRLLPMAESSKVRTTQPDKIMKSRYVLTKKPVEDFAVEDARAADEILDSSEKNQPSQVKPSAVT